MSKQALDFSGLGDTLPAAMAKVESNTDELYTLTPIDGSDVSLGADPSARLVAALGNPTEKTVYLPPGVHVLGVDFTMTSIDSLHIQGEPGKTIIKYDSDTAGLILRAPYSAEYDVTVLDIVTIGNADIQDDEVTRLTIPTGDLSVFKAGKICKIYSDSVSVYGVTAADKNRVGELFKVRSVDEGNRYVYVSGKLYEHAKYLVSVKVRQLEDRTVTLSDIIFEINGTQTELYDTALATREPALQLWGITDLRLNNVRLKSCWGQGVNLIGCWMPDVDVHTEQLINGSDSTWSVLNALGYGVTAMTCYGGTIKVNGEGCRHAFTTTHPKDTSYNASRWLEYGDTIGTRITGTIANSVGSPWDNHESGIGLIYDNCQAISPQRGDNGNIRATGFTNRARHTIYNNPAVIAGHTAIQHVNISHGEVNTVTINNPNVSKCYGTSGAAILIEGANDGNTVASIFNLAAHNNFRILDVDGAKAIVQGGSIGIGGDWFARVKANSELVICGNTVIDFTNAIQSSEHCIRLSGDGAAATVIGAHIAGDSKCASLFYSDDATGTKVPKYINVTSDSGTFDPMVILGTTPPVVTKLPLL